MSKNREPSSAKKTSKKVSGKKSEHIEQPNLIRWRFYLVLLAMFFAFSALITRIAYIQIVEPDNLIQQGALMGSVHFKGASIWAAFPRSKPGEPPARYADALAIAAGFAATRTPEELYRFEEGEEE